MQYPHCDTNILHSPGACEYCDRHPDWQESRIRGRVAFSDTPEDVIQRDGLHPCPSTASRPAEVRDRWPGNTPAGYQPPYLPAPEAGTCDYRMKRGWWCSRGKGHTGPCALRPKWWNLKDKWSF